MAFSDELIRAMVGAGGYSDPAAARHLADVLIARRDTIGRTFLPAINPVVDPALGDDRALTFGNAAVDAHVADAPTAYRSVWFAFVNATGESRRIGEASAAGARIEAPAGVTAGDGSFVRVDLAAVSAAHPAWAAPVRMYFRRAAGAWTLVGFERLPEQEPTDLADESAGGR
jgi:hypothetical protein